MKLMNDWKKDKWIRPFLKKYRWSMIVAIFLGTMTLVCAGALMYCAGYLISKAAMRPDNILLIYVPIVLTRAFGIFRPVFQYAERLKSHQWVLKMTSALRVKLYRILEKEAVFLQGRYQTGDLLHLLSEDINGIQNLYLRSLFPTVVALLLYVIVTISLGCFSIPFALFIAVLIAFVLFVVPIYVLLHEAKNLEEQRSLQHNLYTMLTDNVLGVDDWILSHRSQDYLEMHECLERERDKKIGEHQTRQRRRQFWLQLFFGMIIVSMMVWTSQTFQSNPNQIAAFVLTIFPLVEAFTSVPNAIESLTEYKTSIVRLNQLPDEDVVIEEPKIDVQEPYTLSVNHVIFHYEDSQVPLIKDMNLTIPKKQKVAILGRSGAGKTTLTHLLRGDLIPNDGKVELNGIDVTKFGNNIAKYIGVIQQEPYLFQTTILNNIRLGNESANEEDVYQVLRKVGLYDRIQQLPKGIHTMMAEAGFGFSGGEQQRIALARILLSDVPIVILDEPTIGLDPFIEEQVMNLFMSELKDRTVIWITHHLQSIRLADRILYLKNGELIMDGSYDELMKKNEMFRQFVSFEEI